MITRRTREQVADLADNGWEPSGVAMCLGITEAEVDRILDDADDRAIPHDRPRIEPPAEPAKRSERATRSAPAVRRQPGPARNTVARADVQPCGTPAAYVRHQRKGEETCDECRAARAKVCRDRQRAKGVKPRKPRPPCGTPGGYKAHYARGEKPCEKCRVAYNAWINQRRATRAAQPTKGAE